MKARNFVIQNRASGESDGSLAKGQHPKALFLDAVE